MWASLPKNVTHAIFNQTHKVHPSMCMHGETFFYNFLCQRNFVFPRGEKNKKPTHTFTHKICLAFHLDCHGLLLHKHTFSYCLYSVSSSPQNKLSDFMGPWWVLNHEARAEALWTKAHRIEAQRTKAYRLFEKTDKSSPVKFCMCHAGNPEPSLIHDNGSDAQSRVTVFASRQAFELLSRSSTWYMDRTFGAARRIYT